jgi:hypothetical protein
MAERLNALSRDSRRSTGHSEDPALDNNEGPVPVGVLKASEETQHSESRATLSNAFRMHTNSIHFETSGEAMLQWPIFNDILTNEHKQIQSFVLDSPIDLDTDAPDLLSAPRRHLDTDEIRAYEIARLCRQYVADIHSRNPILDEHDLLRYAVEIEKHGLDWSTQSCLVVDPF